MKVFLIVFLVFALLQFSHGDVVTSIHTDNGLDRGGWGPEEYCPDGSFARSMEILYEERGNVDDTCVNGIKFYCFTAENHMVGYITSLQGKFGTWQGIKECPNNESIIGYALNLEGEVGNFDDDLGVMDVRVECEGGTIIDGLGTSGKVESQDEQPKMASVSGTNRNVAHKLIHKLTKEEKEKYKRFINVNTREGEIGIWGALATCPTGSFVCGIQTRVEDEHLYDDDAGLCDAILFCCN